jgi:hypothetical protein
MRSLRLLARRDEPAAPVVDEAPSAAIRLGPNPTPREAAEMIRMFPNERARTLEQLAAAHGNKFVADTALFLQDLPPLEATADNLKRFREGFPRLRSLAYERRPTIPTGGNIEILPAVLWMREVVETLKIVEPLADPSALLFESLLGTAHDDEYSAAGSRIGPQLKSTIALITPIALELGTALRDNVVGAINRSTVVDKDHDPEPILANLARATEWRELSTALAGLAPIVDRDGAGLHAAALVCQDAALALLQARTVLEARRTWRSGAAVEASDAQIVAGGAGRARNEVDDIFADSGFGPMQTMRGGDEPGSHDWCGMFVSAGMFRASALDKDMRMAFAHTNNVHDFFNYGGGNPDRVPPSIWADGQWWSVREYHASRGLPRTWIPQDQVRDGDIRPGDVALIRHSGTAPGAKVGIANHIVMVESFDPQSGRLVTIEGNVHNGIRAGADGEAKRNAGGELISDAAATDSSVVHIRDLEDTDTKTPKQKKDDVYEARGGQTVFGIGRPSLIDFEDHDYGVKPVPEAYKYLSPGEIRAKGQGALLQKHSTIEAPASGPYHKRVGP